MRIVSSKKRPCAGALHQRLDYWLVDDDMDVADGATVLTAAATRTTMPILRSAGHPLDGRRPLPRVLSGMCDHVIDGAGDVVPVHIVERHGVAVVDDEDLDVVDVREIG